LVPIHFEVGVVAVYFAASSSRLVCL